MEESPKDILYEVESRMPERYGNEVFYKWRKVAAFKTLEEAKKELREVSKKYFILKHKITITYKDS